MCRSVRWAAGPSSDDIPRPIYNSRPISLACFTPPSTRRTAGFISGRSILNAGRFSIEKRSRRACRFRYGMGPWSTSRAINCVSALPILRPPEGAVIGDGEELAEIPSYFYVPPPPASSPVRTNLIEDRAAVALWSGGITSLKVADIVEETADAKTFRLVGEKPLLFSYQPGQFVTLLLTIDGGPIERSSSI